MGNRRYTHSIILLLPILPEFLLQIPRETQGVRKKGGCCLLLLVPSLPPISIGGVPEGTGKVGGIMFGFLVSFPLGIQTLLPIHSLLVFPLINLKVKEKGKTREWS
jgi:hypothetical protein